MRAPRRRVPSKPSPAVGRVTAAPMNPPTAPPATAVTRPATAASGSSEPVQGIGIQIWLQPHSAASPIVPIRTPARAPVATGERPLERRNTASTISASTR